MRRSWVGVVVLVLALARGAAAQLPAPQGVPGSLQRLDLSADGSWWIAAGGNARWRGEDWNGYNFGAPATADPNDAYSLGRLFVNLSLHAGGAVRLFAEGKVAVASDRTLVGGRRTQDEDALDLQQGYAELTLGRAGQAAVQLRLGRQEIALGRERLVSPSDWSNSRRTFEGGTVRLGAGAWSVTGLLLAPVVVQSYAFNHRDPHTLFYGAHATDAKLAAHLGLDLFWFGLRRDSVTINGTTGREDRQTFGMRLFGGAGETGADYEADVSGQVGTVGANRIGAWQAAVLAGWRFAAPLAPRVYAGLDYASGDAAAGGGVGTFNQLFGTAHRYHGYMDVNGGQNLVDASAGGSLTWHRATVLLDLHRFDRASRGDAFYGGTLTVARAAGSGLARHIGDELDVTARYPASRHLLLVTGYSHYFPGAFVSATGSSRDVNLVYLSTQLTL